MKQTDPEKLIRARKTLRELKEARGGSLLRSAVDCRSHRKPGEKCPGSHRRRRPDPHPVAAVPRNAASVRFR